MSKGTAQRLRRCVARRIKKEPPECRQKSMSRVSYFADGAHFRLNCGMLRPNSA